MRSEQMLLFSSQSQNLGSGGRLRRQAPSIPRPMPVSSLAEEEDEDEEREAGEMRGIVLDPMYASYESPGGWIQDGENNNNDDDDDDDDDDLLLYPNPFDEEPHIPRPTRHLTCLVRKENSEKEEEERDEAMAMEEGGLTGGDPRGPKAPAQDTHLHLRDHNHLSGLDLCAGCGRPIVDRYYLVTLNRRWHTTCLRCHHCRQSLDLHLTCFVKDDRIYCKEDYCRLFAPKRCSRCQLMISGQELVIRVSADDIYHADCFVCCVCQRRLLTGDSYAVCDRRVYCRLHYGLLVASGASGSSGNPDDAAAAVMMMMDPEGRGRGRSGGSPSFSPPAPSSSSSSLPVHGGANDPLVLQQRRGPGGPFKGSTGAGLQKGRPRKRKAALTGACTDPINVFGEVGYDLGDVDLLGYHRQGPCSFKDGGCLQGSSSRQKRMRTSFKHHQLRTMKAYFALNHNPDAKDLKELAQKTGLTKRVLQVWFQNARAKYRRNVLKQENENSSSAVNDVIAATNSSAFNGSSSSSSVADKADDVKTKTMTKTKAPMKQLSSAAHRLVVNGASPGFDLSDCSSSSPPSPKTVDASTGALETMDHSTSSSTLLEMFDQTYVHSN